MWWFFVSMFRPPLGILPTFFINFQFLRGDRRSVELEPIGDRVKCPYPWPRYYIWRQCWKNVASTHTSHLPSSPIKTSSDKSKERTTRDGELLRSGLVPRFSAPGETDSKRLFSNPSEGCRPTASYTGGGCSLFSALCVLIGEVNFFVSLFSTLLLLGEVVSLFPGLWALVGEVNFFVSPFDSVLLSSSSSTTGRKGCWSALVKVPAIEVRGASCYNKGINNYIRVTRKRWYMNMRNF